MGACAVAACACTIAQAASSPEQARKAEQARLSRKRKKMRMQELEKESDFLRQEVKRLKTALAAQEHKMAAMATANNSFFKPTTSASDYDEMFKKLGFP